MDKTEQSHLANFWSTDRQYRSTLLPSASIDAKPGDWVNDAWGELLAGRKAVLEHNIHLNLIADRFPNGLGE